MNNLIRTAGILVLIAIILAASGCGGGSMNGVDNQLTRDTGGSIPAGKIIGASAQEPIQKASVQISFSDGSSFTDITDKNGTFFISKDVAAAVTLTVTPPLGSPYSSMTFTGVELNGVNTEAGVYTLPLTTNLPSVTSLMIAASLTPLDNNPTNWMQPNSGSTQGANNNSNSGVPVEIANGANLYMSYYATGQNLEGIHPLWRVSGSIGRINTNGIFTATKRGNGHITAMMGNKSASIAVKVTQ